jgi:hypothetical protein
MNAQFYVLHNSESRITGKRGKSKFKLIHNDNSNIKNDDDDDDDDDKCKYYKYI